MTATLPTTASESMYGSTVTGHDDDLARARAAVQAEQAALAAHTEALDARDDAVRAYYGNAAVDVSQNELARRLGLHPSTFRSIIKPMRSRRR